ncbi:unnamed protein product, partial [Echinostoma caproni]|uniref:Mediator of RNA polymerase II transcription subunit 13 n=1 Tax=Echinostoma caproni TaxID=27848 RepID=A0A183B5E0_9TREM
MVTEVLSPKSGPVVANNENDNSVSLADLLTGRLYNPSPGVRVCLPFLASTEGRDVPLAAYYTYVIEWPFGRKLNDLLKRKLKVMHAELYAMNQERKMHSSGILMEQNMRTTQAEDHPFLACHLGVNYNMSAERSSFMQIKRSSSSLRFFTNGTDQLLSFALAKEDETCYVDFKARAFTKTANSQGSDPKASFSSMSRLWAGKGSLLCGIWNRLLESGDNAVSQRLTLPSLPADWTNGLQQVHRLERSILDPRSHQFFSFLTTLYTSKSFMWPEPCVPPWIATVEYYGLQDLPLGLFLEKCCFTQQHCRHPHCEIPMTEHVQRFVQTTGSVQLVIRKLNQDPPRPTEFSNPIELNKLRPDSRIQMWLLCPHCRSNSPTVYLSGDTWHYSFVKFLDSLINSPPGQGRCALRAPVVSVAESSANSVNGNSNGNNKQPENLSAPETVTATQRLEPILQLT